MKAIPKVQKYMSDNPQTITADLPLGEAKKMFADLRIRHLPVLRQGEVVGLISMRDLMALELEERTEEVQQMRAYISGAA